MLLSVSGMGCHVSAFLSDKPRRQTTQAPFSSNPAVAAILPQPVATTHTENPLLAPSWMPNRSQGQGCSIHHVRRRHSHGVSSKTARVQRVEKGGGLRHPPSAPRWRCGGCYFCERYSVAEISSSETYRQGYPAPGQHVMCVFN